MLRFLMLFFIGVPVADAQLLSQRLTEPSKIFERPHELLIYTPPSYHFDQRQKYPVLYLMDGEYNFNYVTGLIELWSNISPRMPEMIVVGISGYDSDYYRNLMRPNWGQQGKPSDKGDANLMIQAIIEEIVPTVSRKFRANDLKILSGHSVGGLFTTYAAFEEPNAFDYYLAISPSLWWQEETVKNVIGEMLKTVVPEAKLFMSLGNEKGMGVHGFNETIEAQPYEPLQFKFKHFPDESHGSIGLPTYEWALGDIFKDYQLMERHFENGQAVVEYAQQLRKTYGEVLPLNSNFLRNSCYANCAGGHENLNHIDQALAKNFPYDVAFFRVLVAKYFIKAEQFDVAKLWLEKTENQTPDYFELHYAWYLWHQHQGHLSDASKALKKIRRLLKSINIRQWQINELNLPEG